MRTDWVPLSASALVIGAMSLLFGSVMNPSQAGASTGEMLQVVNDESARWLAMAVMYTLASITLTLGLPSVLTLFDRRGRRLAMAGVVLFTVAAIGTCGFAMLMVFFRALVVTDALRGDALNDVTADPGLTLFLTGWVATFYGGVLLLAIALLVARTTPRWVPGLLVAFVAVLPVSSHLGRVGSTLQVMAFAVAFTGMAMTAVASDAVAARAQEPAF
jgi:hypothetical protein